MQKDDTNIVLVGNRPFMNYVMAIVTQLTIKDQTEVVIKARGLYIVKAIDAIEYVRKKQILNLLLCNIVIDSMEAVNKEGRKNRFSIFEATLKKS